MKGSCLCGSIQYEVDEFTGPVRHCHCHSCRKAQAAVFSSNARASRNHFRWLQGEKKLSHFESSPGKLRHFCSSCGSPLMAEWLHEDQVIVRVATLDDVPHIDAFEHIWISHDLDWLNYDVSLKSFSEDPQ
ncbi:MAG: GFA family protein [Mariprofundaceae bacterium]|nr:GFA family protein [Mariprofundaceae bacterium]